MAVRSIVAGLIAAVAIIFVSEADAQLSRDDSPFLTYPPQGSCRALQSPSGKEWLCDITALPDPVIAEDSETPSWTVSFFNSGETNAYATQDITVTLTDYYDLSITCAATGRVVSGAKNACASDLTYRLGAERVTITPKIAVAGTTHTGELPFLYVTQPQPAPALRAWFTAQGVEVLSVEVATIEADSFRLVLALRPPDGVQDTIIRIETQDSTSEVLVRTDTTQDDAPDIFTVQAPFSDDATLLRLAVRGRNFGGAQGVEVYEDPDDTSSDRVGWTPPSTYGYTPWSQLYTVDLAALLSGDDTAASDSQAMHPLVSGLIGDIAKATGQDPNIGLQAPLLVLVAALIVGGVCWWPLRHHKPGGLVMGMVGATIVWTVIGTITGAVPVMLAFVPLIIAGILGVLALRSETA